MNKYDVAIIGAGPAGAICALECAKKGLSAVLIDKNEFIGQTSVCGGLLPASVLLNFDVPRKLIKRKLKGFLINSPSGKKIKLDFKNMGAMSPRKEFDAYWGEQANKQGAKLLLSTRAIKIEPADNEMLVLCETNGKEKEIRAEAVVIANGPASTLAQNLLGNIYKNRNFAIAMQRYYPMKKGKKFDYFEVFHDPSLGYGVGWISPYENTVAIGAGVLHNQGSNIHKRFDEFIGHYDIKDRINLSNELKIEVAMLPFDTFPKKLYGNRFLIIGDAAMLCNPFSGDGVFYAMMSGKFAAETLQQAKQKNDFGENILKEYQNKVEKRFREIFDTSLQIQKTLYSSSKFAEISLSNADKDFAAFLEGVIWTASVSEIPLKDKLKMGIQVLKNKLLSGDIIG